MRGEEEGEGGTTGTVYFTLNGEKQANTFTGCPAEMLPFLHIQKKVIVIMNYTIVQYLLMNIIVSISQTLMMQLTIIIVYCSQLVFLSSG